ncbi:MAG TPA: methyl-accepting chemotaxis protein [Symbiobacteriaceae bacterium]|nr:methyl-accepting chemotaxis protein [Symbiobacteriaceae bacterium]
MDITSVLRTADRRANHWFLVVTWIMSLLATVSVLLLEGLHLWVWAAFQVGLMALPTALHVFRWKEHWVKYIAAAVIPISMLSASIISPVVDINWPLWFISMAAGAYYLTPAIAVESSLLAFVCLFASVIIHPPETRGLPMVQFMSTGVMVMIAMTGLTLAASFRFRRIMGSLDQAAAVETMSADLRTAMAQVEASAATVSAATVELDRQDNQLTASLQQTVSTVAALRRGFEEQEHALAEGMSVIERIAGAVQQLSAAASQQASEVSSATAVVDGFLQGSRETSELVGTVSADARVASETAQRGGDLARQNQAATQQVTEAVDETARHLATLGEHSQRIGSAALLIQGIADQTSMLALNAAIEAARAGEQGRGFAVVAEEVRKLADRSATATREIKEMVEKVEEGIGASLEAMTETRSRVAASAGQSADLASALASILEATRRTSDSMGVLRERSAAMQQGAANLADRFSHLAALAEENAGSAEEMAASTQQMESMAVGLQRIGQEAVSLVGGVERSMAELRDVGADLGRTAERLVELTAAAGRK